VRALVVAALAATAARAGAGPDTQARLQQLHQRGRLHLSTGNYEGALDAAARMLRLAPGHADALRLEQDTHRARLEQPVAIRAASTPLGTSLASEADRESAPLALPDPQDRKTDSAVRLALRRPVSLALDAAPLDDAARRLSEALGVPVALDADVDPTVRVTFPEARMPGALAVRWVARLASVRYRVEDGAVVFSTTRGADADVQERTYDIGSLLGARTKERMPDGTIVTNERSGQGWVKFIRDTVAPETWGEEGDALQEAPHYSIAYRNGRIVVVHTPEVHEEISQLLENFRKARGLQVHITGRFLLISKVMLDALWLDYEFDTFDELPDERSRAEGSIVSAPDVGSLSRFGLLEGGGMTLVYTYIGENLLQIMLQSVLKEQSGKSLLAPRLTCFNTQRAVFQDIINYNYVRNVSSDDEPEIGNVPTGIVFDVQPFVSADRKYITLILQPRLRSLQSLEELSFHDVVGVDEVDIGFGGVDLYQDERIIQLATSVLRSIGTTVTVPDGGTILVAGFVEAEDNNGVSTLPFVEGIPIVKQLLRGWSRNDGRRSYIVLVSAQIVPDLFEE
jgi:hypothetical protein